MIACSVASKAEWRSLCDLLGVKDRNVHQSPFGDLFIFRGVLFFRSLTRKGLSSACTQWVIDHYDVERVVVLGTCAGVDESNYELDLFQFEKAVQCDLLPIEIAGKMSGAEVSLSCLDELSFLKTGIISTMDKPLIMKDEANQLIKEGVCCDDMESAAVALVCEMNHIPCTVIKGISDFPCGLEQFELQDQKYRRNAELIMKKIVEQVLPVLWRADETE